ncbi:hypothetical protein CC77DRAFT_933078 [Alternaria alternata]|uniref:Dpy-30 domain-containing protein n=1 Tax=Alternaria alternata TaxID=5599 RepID=A0A177DRG5_ALTAL|nr:hypothetical protein CC77DRAFT_933078 [Alternaria alternata]XP_051588892.1 uncharacterized protein J4E82_005185 [Alternaria postmessia]KAI5376189.1 hypothetical protein J4E82_005185 [Alternaria postmessia]OAG21731.1 hypothetical protein CC77DRAFT_933078 [Alternaria alternata]
MTEPSPNEAAAQNPDIDPAITNGLAQQASTEQPADVEMTDSGAPPAQDTQSQAQADLQPTVQTVPPTPSTTTPAPPSAPSLPTVPTPTPAASSRNSPHPTAQAPTQPIPHGSPTRVYLNQHVTPHLLEAMKHLATTEPEKPLKWLSEFLAQKSREIEGP